MIDKFFVLHLPDYACPAMVSGEKLYFGTKDDLAKYLNNKNCRRQLSLDENLLEEFLKDTKQKIAYNTHKLGELALVYAEENALLSAKEWEHLNVWSCIYDMSFDKCEVSVVWARYKGKYYRCIKPRFLKLSYFNNSIEEYKFINSFWGQPGFFTLNNTWHECTLYVAEKEFDNLVDAMDDVNSFYAPDIEFSKVIEEVFGDG